MSTSAALAPADQPAASATARPAPSRWILNRPLDLLLFVATPLLLVPLVLAIKSPLIGADVETIGLIVAAFGGFGHHLPGMIRAYGDRELFQRFRGRFILAPLVLVTVCVWLSLQRLNAMLLILLVWGCWHALMQVYGFVRIYDAKVGSVSPVTARWDWLMCLCWFTGGQIFSSGKMARLLELWYTSGGPLVPPAAVQAFQWGWLAICLVVTLGFLGNHVAQSRGPGPRPNPVKLLMLSGGIGFWWFCMVYVDQIILGIALFEAFHDVQYLAIVWLYNCRRVSSTPNTGSFMRFLFRRSRGLLWLYIGLVFAYGAISFTSKDLQSSTLRAALNGFVLGSTILHFYYDGFIWKVRESSTRAALGLGAGAAASGMRRITWGEAGHLLKWSPLVLILGWLTMAELSGSTLPENADGRVWPPGQQIAQSQNIAAAVPADLQNQRRLATALAESGRAPEAIRLLNEMLEARPDYAYGYELLADIYLAHDAVEEAVRNYLLAVEYSTSDVQRLEVHNRLGEIYLNHQFFDEARQEFTAALKIDPQYEPSLSGLSRARAAERSR
ncbi:MAG: tetratricopeptide repeat protein [Planctomycetaceae bacterium]|nr:tetratricopeptide repeat protein [Planctomycetaceae bacterium]